ncbi:Cof-type HAD-IIB family hydrolase [Alkalibacterium kapii]|uniref:Haloacid dehalogenase n=1 Tax=Alkalibacterium kapii TaxID=426704 RepID=A0A511ASN0_9LACT|nr:Cof-type HAD-IIB family hydrolase [Alkalibacterium kapii]GEK91208.1 haloacid dehalogenase [Alkalibacterium kapii]
MSIKLVAIDLDGTLLNSNHEVSFENKEAIRKAKEQGVKVVLVTGRPLKAMLHILEACNLTDAGDIALTYNGGLVQWTQSGETLNQIVFQKDESIDIYKLSQDLGLPCNFIDLNTVYEPPYPKGKPSRYPEVMHALPFEPIDMTDLPEEFPINKIVYCWDQEELDEKIKEIPNIYRERYNLIKSRPNLLEFMPKSIDKGKGLELLSEILDISVDDMMAIGDQENDLAMVQRAGTGVAMENAVPIVKDAAQIITKTNDAHGVAYAIEKYVLN